MRLGKRPPRGQTPATDSNNQAQILQESCRKPPKFNDRPIVDQQKSSANSRQVTLAGQWSYKDRRSKIKASSPAH
jgi:hypothetical protein